MPGGSTVVVARVPVSTASRNNAPSSADNGTTRRWLAPTSMRTTCGTIYGGRTIVSNGTLKNPGLPYGTGFTVCAVDGTRKVSRVVDNTSYNAPSATTTNTLALPTSGGTCPFPTT